MRKCLVLLGTGLLLHALLAVGCAEGEENAALVPDPDASAEASSSGGTGADASTEAGKEGGAGTSGSAGASGASGASGSAGTGGQAGSAGGGAGTSGSAGASGASGASGSAGKGGQAGSAGGGGASTGGSSTGGSSTGGSSTGGSSTGGSSTGGSGTGGSAGYTHTITIGSGNDFVANEIFLTTSSPAFTGYVTWDQTHIYVGMDGPDIGNSSANRFLLIYIGIPLTAGSTTGFKYTTQQPGLPFEAHYLIAMKTDGSYQEAREYTGGQWATKTWDFSGHFSKSGSFFEAAIERQSLGSPAKVRLHMSMINETSGSEGTFAGVPSSSFTDGYNPPYAKYFEFDLTSSKPPKEYLPLP